MNVINQTKQTILAKKFKVARNFMERFRGLIGSPPLEEGEGFLIPSCQGIHTFGMSYPIDALYLNQTGEVISVVKSLFPNSIGVVNFRAHSVLELPSGTIEFTHTEVGDLVSIPDFPFSSPTPLSSREDSSFANPIFGTAA